MRGDQTSLPKKKSETISPIDLGWFSHDFSKALLRFDFKPWLLLGSINRCLIASAIRPECCHLAGDCGTKPWWTRWWKEEEDEASSKRDVVGFKKSCSHLKDDSLWNAQLGFWKLLSCCMHIKEGRNLCELCVLAYSPCTSLLLPLFHFMSSVQAEKAFCKYFSRRWGKEKMVRSPRNHFLHD